MTTSNTDQIIADAEIAKAKDEHEGLVTAAVMLDPLMEIPRWLQRGLPQEEQDAAWLAYCQERCIQASAPRAPAPKLTRVFAVEEKRDLRAEAEAEKTRTRITKMKAGQERKKLSESGALKAMPLSGKDALAKIKGDA